MLKQTNTEVVGLPVLVIQKNRDASYRVLIMSSGAFLG